MSYPLCYFRRTFMRKSRNKLVGAYLGRGEFGVPPDSPASFVSFVPFRSVFWRFTSAFRDLLPVCQNTLQNNEIASETQVQTHLFPRKTRINTLKHRKFYPLPPDMPT